MVKDTPVNFLPFVLLAAAFASIYAWNFTRTAISGQQMDTTRVEHPAENFLAPDFTLPLLDGEKVSLSGFRGNVVFLNFWATWCVTCEEEMPSMEKLYQRFKNDKFKMLTVSIDQEGAKKVRPYMERFGLTFPAMLDPKKNVANLYKTTGVPETFIINKAGVIIHKAIGPRDWSTPAVMETFERMVTDDR